MLHINVVGQFSQANKWNTMGHSFISNTMAQVAQPVLTNADNEEGRQQRVFRKMLRFTSLICFPLMFGLALVAHEFIVVTIGEKWEPCVILLQILCIGGAFIPLQTLYQNLIISRKRSDIYLRLVVLQILLQIILTLSLVKLGIVAMVTAFSALNMLFIVCWHFALQRILPLTALDVLKDTIPFTFIAAVVMLTTHYATLSITNLWLLLLARIMMAAMLYLIVMRLLNVAILKECLQFIRKKQ
jgi:O-antigen/teichoic acid export membrane protein